MENNFQQVFKGYEKGIQKQLDKINFLKEKKMSLDENNPKYDAMVKFYDIGISQYQRNVDRLNKEMRCTRPPIETDIIERQYVHDNLGRMLNIYLDDNCKYCFHGTSYINAEEIIKSGKISSSVDRLGYETSMDAEGFFSVTTKDTVQDTLRSYCQLDGFYHLPAGCVFVIQSKNEKDFQLAESSMSLKNVDFAANPDRLVAILSTTENVGTIQSWLKKSQIKAPSSIVQSFRDFENKVIEKN